MSPEEQTKLTSLIKSAKVVIIPTDTIYGIVGLAKNQDVVERIYSVKDREHTKPFVVLISDYSQLKELGIDLEEDDREHLESIWPGPTSVVIPTSKMEHLHNGRGTLAIRMPKDQWLRDIIDHTGPIVATSANIAGQDYTHNIVDIKKTFLEKVDYISDSKAPVAEPSRIIDLASKKILR